MAEDAKVEEAAKADVVAEAAKDATKDEAMTEPKDEAKDEAKEKPEEPQKPKEPETPKELEKDSPDDSRSKLLLGKVAINELDTTMNCMPVAGGGILMALNEGGMNCFLAGARSNVGMKAGRYMFEVKIIETHKVADQQSQLGRTVRVGVSLSGSSLFLDGLQSASFDMDGFFASGKTRKRHSKPFSSYQTLALLVNLDPGSPNANTLSLFSDGKRISEPQALPESLCGQVLYPTITYRNVTLQVNFGPSSKEKLPFSCRMLADAAEADIDVSKVQDSGSDKCDVLFPVGLPDKGFFAWVDAFSEANPDYVELSDRKIIEWAVKSGLNRPKGVGSNDKPDMRFGVSQLDYRSVRSLIWTVAATLKRNYIVPELKQNLVSSDRASLLVNFNAPQFKKSATILMGEPSSEYKQRVHSRILKGKQDKADAEKKRKIQEAVRKKALDEKRKKAEEARSARLAAQRKKEGKEDEGAEMKDTEEGKAELAEEAADAEMEDSAPVELTDEEKQTWHPKSETPDLAEQVLAKSYSMFALPSTEEGFDQISYAWQPETSCSALLKDWVLDLKRTQKVEDLKPGTWFKEEFSKWSDSLRGWRKRQQDWKDPSRKKAMIMDKKVALKKKAAENNQDGEEQGDDKPLELPEIDPEDIDIFSVEDVCDLGNCEPLFANFAFEDWMLLSTRVELHLLIHAFRKDLDDADRPSFTESHLSFYFEKYFRKSFSVKNFNVDSLSGIVEHIKDTISVSTETGFLAASLPDDTPMANFVKLAEDQRRDRLRRVDAGDETAQLKFQRPATPPATPPPRAGAGAGGSGSSRPGAVGGGIGSRRPEERRPEPPRTAPGRPEPPRTAPGGSSSRPTPPRSSPWEQRGQPTIGQKRSSAPAPTSDRNSKQPRTSSSYSGGGAGGGSSYSSGGSSWSRR